MSNEDACYILACWIKQFNAIIYDLLSKSSRSFKRKVRCQIGEIITHLGVVGPYINSIPRYWIEPDVEKLCHEILIKLTEICLWPHVTRFTPCFIVKECNQYLASLWANKGQVQIEKSILLYFGRASNAEQISALKEKCEELSHAIGPAPGQEGTCHRPNLKQLAQKDYTDHNRALYRTLRGHCQCQPGVHNLAVIDNVWHPARLYMEAEPDCSLNYDIVVSSQDMSSWQEFRLNIPSDTPAVNIEPKALAKGQFCSFLEERRCARLNFSFHPDHGLFRLLQPSVKRLMPAAGGGERLSNILHHYRLTSRDRIILSYTISKAYWKFYDSDLMSSRWSSDSIWFMPSADNRKAEQLPLQAYVSLPFEDHRTPPPDLIDDITIELNHRSPRIFALGILLLEIGLAKPFLTVTQPDQLSQANFDHLTALNLLETLREKRLSGLSHEALQYFFDAVKYCLDGENFMQRSKSINPTRSTNRRSGYHSIEEGIQKRRKDIHDNVVLPLAYLALKVYKVDTSEIVHIQRITSGIITNPILEQPYSNSSFYSDHSNHRAVWLDHLKGISSLVHSKRETHQLAGTIRVAILDTGVNFTMPYYTDQDDGQRRRGSIVWKDFVNVENPDDKVDVSGHGTLMARLVMEICPFAKILIARVAKRTKDLLQSQDNIHQAVRWAKEEGADIISMSFALPRDNDSISREIHEVSKNAVILAGAGNSPEQPEAFPARHPDVISIYATSRVGTFLDTNSRRPFDGSDIIGTFGDSIPPDIQQEFDQEYRGICSPGSSIATAVAAGISATMLAYISVLPCLGPVISEHGLRVLRQARSSSGMAAVFRAMALPKSDRRVFLTPAQFWRDKNTDEARYNTVSHCLWDVDRQRPENPGP